MKNLPLICVSLILAFLQGCSRVETGEVGLRVGFDKQVQKTELQPGSFNQVMIGDVLIFPIKQIGIDLKDLHPITSDHTPLKDLELQIIYSINPASAYDLYTTKSHSLNAIDNQNNTLLMYSYMQTIGNSAAQKAVSEYNALDVPIKRSSIEADIKQILVARLSEEKMDSSIIVDQVNVKNAVPADQIVESAMQVINNKNKLAAKNIELDTATVESKLQDVLAKPANIAYMKAKSELNISEGVKDGKVQTILIPHNLTMFGGVNK